MQPQIPTIDLSLPRATVVNFIRIACLTHGFFQITSHQFPPLLQEALFEYSKRLFALPTAEKTLFKRPEYTKSGYEAFRSYSLQPTRGKPDLNEGFCMLPVSHGDHDGVDGDLCWPVETEENGLVGFKECCRQYQSVIENLAKTLAGYIAEGLELQSDYFDEYFNNPMTQTRLIHYFVELGQEDIVGYDKQPIGAGLHSDWSLLTVLLQDAVGGLEVLDPDSGSFIPVHPTPDALVVNVGDTLARLTNGVYISAQHRVLAPPLGVHRYSIPFFCHGNPEYVVDVLQLSDDWEGWTQGKGVVMKAGSRVRKWEPITSGAYLAMKFRQAKAGGKQTVA